MFPTSYPITPDNMNWTAVVLGGTLLIGGFYWVFSARYWFVGPKRFDPSTLGQDASAI